MAQAEIIPSEFSFLHQFDELPLFWQFQPAVGMQAPIRWRGGEIAGQFEITYNIFSQDHFVSDLWISVHNGETGPAAKGELVRVTVETDDRLYWLMRDIIDLKYASMIEERIAEEISQLRYAA